jgi:hypothetical protein
LDNREKFLAKNQPCSTAKCANSTASSNSRAIAFNLQITSEPRNAGTESRIGGGFYAKKNQVEHGGVGERRVQTD